MNHQIDKQVRISQSQAQAQADFDEHKRISQEILAHSKTRFSVLFWRLLRVVPNTLLWIVHTLLEQIVFGLEGLTSQSQNGKKSKCH